MIHARPGRLTAVALGLGLLLGACSEDQTTALVLVSDGRSPAVDDLIDSMAQDPARVFASERIGLETVGTVVVATYNLTGDLDTVSFNLLGHGPDRVRRDNDARAQAAALGTALDELPDHQPGNALRAIRNAVDITEARADAATLVLAGLGRAVIDDFHVEETDLTTPERRAEVIEALQAAGYLPALRQRQQLIVLAPSEGVASGIVASQIDAFASELCAAIHGTCTVERSLP